MGFLTFSRRDAFENGAATFYTGRPCVRGHIGLRYTNTKACRQCARDRALGAYYDNPEALRAANAAWRAANPERVAKYAERRSVTGAMRRAHRAWVEANPGKAREYGQRRRARLRACEVNDLTAADVAAITALQNGRCACCAKAVKLTIDHIRPLSKGGANTRRNVQMLCRSCNSRKRASDPIEFARKLGRLL